MLLTTLTEITDAKRIQRVQRLYQHDIAALETLGFRVLTYYEEAWQPDSILHVPIFFGRALWNLWFNRQRETFGWQPPFTICLYHPVLIHEETGTFAHIFGLGTCYMAGFLNGGLLMSATYNVYFQSRPELHYYRESNPDNPTIASVWKVHKRKLQSLKNDGYLLYPELTFGLYTELNALNERVALGMRKTKD